MCGFLWIKRRLVHNLPTGFPQASAIDGYAVLGDGRGGAAMTSLDPEASRSPGNPAVCCVAKLRPHSAKGLSAGLIIGQLARQSARIAMQIELALG